MLQRARVERVGHQHRVVDRRHLDAVARKHQPVVLDVLADLQHRRIFERRLQRFERRVERDLVLLQPAAKNVAVARRGGRAGCSRRGPARCASAMPQISACIGLGADRLHLDRDDAALARRVDPALKLVEPAHAVIVFETSILGSPALFRRLSASACGVPSVLIVSRPGAAARRRRSARARAAASAAALLDTTGSARLGLP